MTRLRSPGFWALLVLSAALSIWWTLHVPYAPARLYAAIPRDAVFVTEHRDLARRWQDFSANPATRSLLISLGLTPDDIKDLRDDPVARAWLERLASRQVVLAFVPHLGVRGEPAWVLASWLGGASQRLRWSLAWQRGGDFVPCRTSRGRSYWKVASRSSGNDGIITIAIEEGMIVACLSRHEDTMSEVLDTVDGLVPSWTAGNDFAARPEASVQDRGWVSSRAWTRDRLTASVFTYAFSELTASGLVGVACGPAGGLAATTGAGMPDLRALDRVFGDLPLALGVVPSGLVLTLCAGPVAPPWLTIVTDLIRREGAGAVAMTVLGGDHSGRFKGIKVPSAVIGIPVKDSGAALARVKETLDRLNASCRWGLIPREVAAGDHMLYAVESTGEGLLAGLSLPEKPAYTVCEGWLWVASNVEVLQKLVEQLGRSDAMNLPAPRWHGGLEDGVGQGYAWMDLARGGKTLKLAIVTYSLKLLVQNAEGTVRMRQRINEAKAWIDSLAPMDTCSARLRSVGDRLELHFRMGPEHP